MNRYLYFLLGVFTAVTGFYFWCSWAQLAAGQGFVYPLDDVYIHMALARNFAEHGVWSVMPQGFDSASSSILYTLLLAGAIKVFGDQLIIPLVLNVIAGYITIYIVWRFFRDFFDEQCLKWGAVLLLPFTLLYLMVMVSMEQTLHMMLIAAAVYLLYRNSVEDFSKRSSLLLLMLLVFLVGLVRFESMFFTASLAFSLFLRRKFWTGTGILAAGFIPILVFGLISVQLSGMFFPNSVMVKGSYPSENGSFLQSIWQIFENGILLNRSFYKIMFFPLLIILIHLYLKYRSVNGGLKKLLQHETLLITVVLTGILHSLFASLGYRYENYLMMMLLMVIVPVMSKVMGDFRFADLLKINVQSLLKFSSLAIIAVAVYRLVVVHYPALYGTRNIAEQQIEMSRFLGEFYRGETVVANDIGAISYFSGVDLVDLVGLGTTDIAKMEVELKNYPQEIYSQKASAFLQDYFHKRNSEIAVIYPGWFPGDIPEDWEAVAAWKFQDNYVAARDSVVFYSLKPEATEKLRESILRFDLNRRVQQTVFSAESAQNSK